MFTVQHVRYDDEDYPIRVPPISHLLYQIWPPQQVPTSTEVVEKWRARKCHHFVIYDESEPLAHAAIFVRKVITSGGLLPVGALGGVCVHPRHRGKGWGRDVAVAAFDFLPELGVDVSLFQTPVPEFYERLGCRLVENRFFNGDDPNDPFMDKYKMIYPVAFEWPDGDIDLNGPGY